MRNMSFALTMRQIRDGTKDVTRRLGWKFLKPGDRVQACVKCMGLKPGEKIQKLRVIEIVSNTRERLDLIDLVDVYREGFPELNADEFVEMFCEHMGVKPGSEVNRIEFKYV